MYIFCAIEASSGEYRDLYVCALYIFMVILIEIHLYFFGLHEVSQL